MTNENTGSLVQLSSPLLLLSSQPLGWHGVTVEKRRHPGGKYNFPPSDVHLISVHTGPSLTIEQGHGDRSHQALTQKGNIALVPRGQSTHWSHEEPADFINIKIDPKFLFHSVTQGDDASRKDLELVDLFFSRDSTIEQLCSLFVTELESSGATGRLYAEGLAIALSAYLLHTYTTEFVPSVKVRKGLPTPTLQRITAMIEDRLTENLSLTELADEAGLSPSHFSSMFRRTTGFSPHQYVVRRRIERAQALLRSSNLSIGEIATAVGFYDQSHLVHHMRRILGLTPRRVRENLP